MLFSKINVLFLVLLFSLAVKAQEGGGNVPTEKTSKAYNDTVTQMNTYQSRVNELKKEIRKIILLKNSTKNKEEQLQYIEQMEALQVSLKSDTEAYNRIRKTMILRFPGKGKITKRRYLPLKDQSIDEIESEMGLDAQLSAVKGKIENKYREFNEKAEQKKRKKIQEKREEKAKSDEAPEDPEKLKLEL